MKNQSQVKSIKNMSIIILAVLFAVFAYYILNAPDKRGAGEKISDAYHELPNGVGKASRQLENRTLGDKLNDSIDDTTNNIKKTSN